MCSSTDKHARKIAGGALNVTPLPRNVANGEGIHIVGEAMIEGENLEGC